MYGNRTDDRYSFDSLEVSLRQRIRWTRVEVQSEGHSTAASQQSQQSQHRSSDRRARRKHRQKKRCNKIQQDSTDVG